MEEAPIAREAILKETLDGPMRVGGGTLAITLLMPAGKGSVILTFSDEVELKAELLIVAVTSTVPVAAPTTRAWEIVPKRSALPKVMVAEAGHVATQDLQSTSIYAVAILVIPGIRRSEGNMV